MNKLISKIVGVCLGLSLATGVGVGVAVSNKEVQPAYAVDYNASSFADLTTGAVGVIVGNNGSNYALGNNNGASSAPSAISVTVANNKITSAVTNAMLWEVTKNSSNYTFTVYGGSSKLYCFSNNNGLRVGDGSDNTFSINSDYLYNNGQSRYIGIYSSQDWRSYTSINNNIKNQTFKFYVQSSGSTATPLTTPAPVHNVAAGTISWTVDTNADHYEISLDNASFVTASSPYTIPTLAYGTHTISVIAKGDGTHYSDSEIGTLTFALIEHAGTQADPYSVADALGAIDIHSGVENVYATGIVSRITTPYDSGFGNVSFDISDDGTTSGKQLRGYRTVGTQNYPIDSEDSVQVGDIVILYGSLTKYNSTYEFEAGNQLVYLFRKEIESIDITGSLTKTSYTTAESWSPAGLTVTAYYNDDTDVDVTSEVTWSYSPTSPLAMGGGTGKTLTITATYEGQTDSTSATVDVTVPSYTNTSSLTPGDYYIKFDTHYFTGSISSGKGGSSTTKPGDAGKFTFNLVGNDTWAIVNANGDRLGITGNDSTKLFVGENDTYTFKIIDGTSGKYKINSLDFTTRYVAYYDSNDDFRTYTSGNIELTLESAKEVSGLTVDTTNANKNVLKGTTFDAAAAASAGFQAKLNYTDSTFEDVTSAATWTLNTSVVNNNATLTVTYLAYTATVTGMNVYTVTITSLTIDSSSAKTVYSDGEALSVSGLVITGHDSSNNDYPISIDSCTFSPANGTSLTTANTSVSVTYTNDDSSTATGSYSITVNAFAGYTKVTSLADLTPGDSYVIGVANTNETTRDQIMCGKNASKDYRDVAAGTFNGDYSKVSSTLPSGAVIVTVISDGDGNYYIYDITSDCFIQGSSVDKTNECYNQTTTKNLSNMSWNITFENGLASVVLVGSTRVFGYNIANPRFATYASYAASTSAANGTAHPVFYKLTGSTLKTDLNTFQNSSLKMDSYDVGGSIGSTGGDGSCSSYYASAKTAFNSLSEAKRQLFVTCSDYSAALQRLNEWARLNGDEIDADNLLATANSRINILPMNVDNSAAIFALIAISMVSMTVVGAYFLLHKKKEVK